MRHGPGARTAPATVFRAGYILLGFATSGVVLSTTRYAADADYRLIIVEDCCADRDAAVHDFLCQKIFPNQADVVQSSDVIRALA